MVKRAEATGRATASVCPEWMYERYCYVIDGVLCWGKRLRPEYR